MELKNQDKMFGFRIHLVFHDSTLTSLGGKSICPCWNGAVSLSFWKDKYQTSFWTGMGEPSAALREKALLINDPTEGQVYEPSWLLKARNVCVSYRLGHTPFPSADFPGALKWLSPGMRHSLLHDTNISWLWIHCGSTWELPGVLQELLPALLAKSELLV